MQSNWAELKRQWEFARVGNPLGDTVVGEGTPRPGGSKTKSSPPGVTLCFRWWAGFVFTASGAIPRGVRLFHELGAAGHTLWVRN